MFLPWEELPEQLRATSTSTTTTTRSPMARPARRWYWRGGRFPPLSWPIDGRCRGGARSSRGRRGGGGSSGSWPPPEGRVTAVSCVPPVSSQSESKKSSGATGRTLSACPDTGFAGVSWSPANLMRTVAEPARATLTPPLTGRLVADRYTIEEELGRGGFGTVYGASADGGERVAVKVFSRREGLAPRADREARTARKLDHPNIHTVLGVENDDDHVYLVSQLVEGERLDRSGLADDQAVRAIAAVCDALAYAHSRGIVHRDVKPANILVARDGTVTLTDFGIASDEDARDQTVDERVLGTLSYMSPEQAAGTQATGATDVWAAGLTLYTQLTGSNPYKAKTLTQLLEKLAAGAEPLADVRPDLPKGVCRAIDRALEHNPSRRPDASEMRDRLLRGLAEAEAGPSEVKAPPGGLRSIGTRAP